LITGRIPKKQGIIIQISLSYLIMSENRYLQGIKVFARQFRGQENKSQVSPFIPAINFKTRALSVRLRTARLNGYFICAYCMA
jgi:hypothetical protein